MSPAERYIDYITHVRRYSPRTRAIYADVLGRFIRFAFPEKAEGDEIADSELAEALSAPLIRGYEMQLLKDNLDPRTVNLHISVLSGFCRFLMKQGVIKSNPARSVTRPKTDKRLPVFYRKEDMKMYFMQTEIFVETPFDTYPEAFMEEYLARRERPGYRKGSDPVYAEIEKLADKPARFSVWLYEKRLRRLIISILYSTGIRRAELISLKRSSVDFSRGIMRVTGKGDKTREIPMVASLCKEISLYLQAVEATVCGDCTGGSPLLVTPKGGAIYPMYVDRAVKSELGEAKGFTTRKSPHVLRHTLATELLEEGTDLNTIKELLGHSSLAATQVYTHNSIAKLKKVYETAHPRAKSGGKHGD